MFDLTPYSAFTVLLITSIFILLFVFITNRNSILSKIPMWLLVLFVCIMCFRLIFPFEILLVSKNINSFDIMPYYDDIVLAEINIFGLTVNIWNIVCIIWLIGVIICITKYFSGYFMFTSKFKYVPTCTDSRLINVFNTIQKEFKYKFNVKIISNRYIDSPAEYGFFKKVILIDADRYTEEELYYILLHELTHFRIKTNYVKFVTCMIRAVLWWNPAIYLLYEHVDNIMEVYVDRFVVKHGGSARSYMECIISVFKKSEDVNYNKNYVQPIALLSDDNVVLKRFKLIAMENKLSIKFCVLLSAMLVMYIFVSSRYVIQPAYDVSETDMKEPSFNEDNTYIIKENDTYYLYYNDELFIVENDLDYLPKGLKIIERGD